MILDDEENIRNTTKRIIQLQIYIGVSFHIISKPYLIRQFQKKCAQLKNKVKKAKRAHKKKKSVITSDHVDDIGDELVLKISRHSGKSTSSKNL